MSTNYHSRHFSSRGDEHSSKKRNRDYSSERSGGRSSDSRSRTYGDILKEQREENERTEYLRKLKREKNDKIRSSDDNSSRKYSDHDSTTVHSESRRWSEDPEKKDPQLDGLPEPTETSSSVYSNITPKNLQMLRLSKELQERNRHLTDTELDEILPSDGYEIVKPPESYKPQTTTKNNPLLSGVNFYNIPEDLTKPYDVPGDTTGTMPQIKPEDLAYFGMLLKEVDFDSLSYEEQKERRIAELLLKIKNGNPIIRKQALRQITEKARELGPSQLFSQILPLMMSVTLEDHERHLLVKVIDRILYKLDDLVRPYVHKILIIIEPMLTDEDYYARVEAREIISSLSKAAGLPTMIATMRPDIDNVDENVRSTTARAFAVVASALGVPTLLPFLKAVCASKKSWIARHTGIKIVQQIAILLGCAILPHLKNLVEIIQVNINDEQPKVRTVTALAIAALAEAAYPYGIEAFDCVLRPLWEGINCHQGRYLAAFLKAMGFIIPLMDAEHAGACTRKIMPTVIREFDAPEEEMKRIVLKVLKQCVSTEGVSATNVKEMIMNDFFRCFWIRRIALDKKSAKQVVETTVEIANKVGGGEVISRIVDHLKDESEPYRKTVLETIEKIVINLGVADIGSKIEEKLMDGMLFAFQEHTNDDSAGIINGFGTIINALGSRCKVSIPYICGIIQWRLNNKSPRVRMQAADLVSKTAPVMKTCGEDMLMGKMGVVLFECLGEEYPEVLGSVLGALKSIVNSIGMTKMTPPIKDLLPRLTPILKNRHDKVQENVIELIGRIADRGAEYVSAKEWMRICFDLLDLLKAHKKAVRRATINTFGFIAKAIGPHDVLGTLLNNLKVQERQNRVCTTVAIAIVAEICGPFTVIPALMNEYRVPEINVQNGVLKSFSFMFEYIGEMSKDYVYAVTPLLEDALVDRDLVHRQTACTAIKHLSLGVAGLGCEDALTHLLNFVWPNIFETSPHVINSVIDALDGLRMALGVGRIFTYVIQGLFHSARRVRDVYWRVYNLLYLGNQDGLVLAYPRLSEDKASPYNRPELELFL